MDLLEKIPDPMLSFLIGGVVFPTPVGERAFSCGIDVDNTSLEPLNV